MPLALPSAYPHPDPIEEARLRTLFDRFRLFALLDLLDGLPLDVLLDGGLDDGERGDDLLDGHDDLDDRDGHDDLDGLDDLAVPGRV